MTADQILSLDPPVENPISEMAHKIIRKILTDYPNKIDEVETAACLKEKEKNLLKIDTGELKKEYFSTMDSLEKKIGHLVDIEGDFNKLKEWGITSLLFIVLQVELSSRGLSINSLLEHHYRKNHP